MSFVELVSGAQAVGAEVMEADAMKLTTITQLTLDGGTQGNGGPTSEDREDGFERG